MPGLSCKPVQVPAEVAAFPAELFRDRTRAIALCDFLTRAFGAAVSSAGAGVLPSSVLLFTTHSILFHACCPTVFRYADYGTSVCGVLTALNTGHALHGDPTSIPKRDGPADVRTQSGGWKGNKGGEMIVDVPGQHVLERTSCSISSQVGPRCCLLLHQRSRSSTHARIAASWDCGRKRFCMVIAGLHAGHCFEEQCMSLVPALSLGSWPHGPYASWQTERKHASMMWMACNAGRPGSPVHCGTACQGAHHPGQLGSPAPHR